jgi:hypothetical protein
MKLPISIKIHDKFAIVCHPDCAFIKEDENKWCSCLLFSKLLSKAKLNKNYGELWRRDWRCIIAAKR